MRAFLSLLFLMPILATSQLHPYKWRLGFHGGFSTYYGDLTPYRLDSDGLGRVLGHLYTYNAEYVPMPSWQISLERYLNPTISLKMTAGNAVFSANDRFVKPDGTLWTEAPFFDRGLNVETSLYDASIGLIFRTDNLRFLSHRAFIAPYFGLHAVLLNFDTYADLRDNEGNFYNLSNPNLRQNGTYETPLVGLKTEGIEYSTLTIGGRLEFGIQMRLSRRLNLNISTQLTLTSTDYLDDVSLDYPAQFESQLQQRASDPTNRRLTTSIRGDDYAFDSYLFHSVGLQWSFGSRGKMKKFPAVGGFAPPPKAEKSASIFDSAIQAEASPAGRDEVDTLIELMKSQQSEINQLRTSLNQTINGLKIVEARFKISDYRTRAEAVASQVVLADDSIGYFKKIQKELSADTILPKSVRDSLAVSLLQRQRLWEKRRDSLNTQLDNLRFASDSLTNWVALHENTIEQIQPLAPAAVKSIPALTTPPSPLSAPTPAPSSVSTSLPQPPADESAIPIDTAVTDELSLASAPIETPQMNSEKQPENIPQKSNQKTQSPRAESSTTNQYQREKTPSSTPSRSTSRPTDSSTRTSSTENSRSTQTRTASAPSLAIQAEKSVANESDTSNRNDRATMLKILEQQTELLRLLTEQVTAISSNQKPQKESSIQNNRTNIRTSQPGPDREGKTSSPDTLEESSDLSRGITFSTIAGFKFRSAVYFQSGRTSLDSTEEAHLRDIARYLADSTSSLIILRGYADNTGTQRANFAIINRRLEYIRQILVTEGVSAGRIRLEKGGIIVTSTPGSNPRDRRVEITLVHTDGQF